MTFWRKDKSHVKERHLFCFFSSQSLMLCLAVFRLSNKPFAQVFTELTTMNKDKVFNCWLIGKRQGWHQKSLFIPLPAPTPSFQRPSKFEVSVMNRKKREKREEGNWQTRMSCLYLTEQCHFRAKVLATSLFWWFVHKHSEESYANEVWSWFISHNQLRHCWQEEALGPLLAPSVEEKVDGILGQRRNQK